MWDVAHAQIFELHEWTKNSHKKLRVVANAYFSKNPFIQLLIDKGINVVTRLRNDAVAHFDPNPSEQKTRGPIPSFFHMLYILKYIPVL